MFNFFKKKKEVNYTFTIPEQKPEPTIRERALKLFSDIEGLDDLKEILLLAIEAEDRVSILLVGPPASAKSLLAKRVLEIMGEKGGFCDGSSTTKQGFRNYSKDNRTKKWIVIDEIDKMKKVDQEGLLSILEDGIIADTKVHNTERVKVNMAIFATSNSTERLSKPLLSRFDVFEIPEYTYEEFEAIAVKVCKRLNRNIAIKLASSVWQSDQKDIRKVIQISKLLKPEHTEEDISRIITIHMKHVKTGREFN